MPDINLDDCPTILDGIIKLIRSSPGPLRETADSIGVHRAELDRWLSRGTALQLKNLEKVMRHYNLKIVQMNKPSRSDSRKWSPFT